MFNNAFLATFTAWKVSQYGIFSGPYFPVFGLNTEICGVNLCIQSEYGKIRTTKNSVFGLFIHSVFYCLNISVNIKYLVFFLVMLMTQPNQPFLTTKRNLGNAVSSACTEQLGLLPPYYTHEGEHPNEAGVSGMQSGSDSVFSNDISPPPPYQSNYWKNYEKGCWKQHRCVADLIY